jgi:glycerol-3-phosphate dehydrogenase (NAD(P)+)
VELGGALKNVIAISAGISDGLGLGDNSKAALMTRGLHEITRLGVALGAQPQTFAGLAGMGDLIVTCCSRHSRNRLLGEKIGKGTSLEQALSEMVMVAEGVKTSHAAMELAQKAKVEVPITDEVYKVLFEKKSAKEAVKSLMARAARAEQDPNVW